MFADSLRIRRRGVRIQHSTILLLFVFIVCPIRMKRRRMPSILLRNCYVQMTNFKKRIRHTDGSESGHVKRFMPAEDLVKV